MADPAVVKGPGMLWVMSSISRPDIMDEKTYMKWYDEDHIAEIMETDGIKTAYRYKDVDIGKVDKPYLAFYPMKDLAFTLGPDFKHIRVKSDLLPGSGLCYDLADIDVRYIGLVGKTDYAAPKKGMIPSFIHQKPGLTKIQRVHHISFSLVCTHLRAPQSRMSRSTTTRYAISPESFEEKLTSHF
jgi:hypothetical protein